MMTNLTLGTGEPPKQFGRYRILMKLGQGGMGAVYLAHDPELNRLVALKVPLDEGETDAAVRFRRAARAAASLHHPNICPLYEAGVIDGTPFLTMAYIDGTTLAERLRLGRLPSAEAAALVRTLALALAEAHDSGVFHRDLKPSNILINRRGEPILTDFGAASLGTPAYLPPERVHGEADPDGRAADVYSLGVILYELLTGRPPPTLPSPDAGGGLGGGPTESALFDRILHNEPAPPSAHVPDLDPRFDALCRTATARYPAERYPDMAAFAAALAPFGAAARAERKEESWSLPLSTSGDIHPVTGRGKSSEPPPRPSPWPWRLVAVGAAGMAVMAGAAYVSTQMRYLQNPTAAPPIAVHGMNAAEAHLDRARDCFAENDMPEAIREATEAVRRRPALVAALVLRGRAEYRQGADAAADADFLEAHRRFKQGAADAPSAREITPIGHGAIGGSTAATRRWRTAPPPSGSIPAAPPPGCCRSGYGTTEDGATRNNAPAPTPGTPFTPHPPSSTPTSRGSPSPWTGPMTPCGVARKRCGATPDRRTPARRERKRGCARGIAMVRRPTSAGRPRF